jgi:hypothetical protein
MIRGEIKEVRDGLVVIAIPKALVVLTDAEFVRALRRGKHHRQAQNTEVRTRKVREVSPPAGII